MAYELTPTSQYVTITAPQGGDARTATSVEAGLQDLADCAEYLRDRTPGGASFWHWDVPLPEPAAGGPFTRASFTITQSSTTTPFYYVPLLMSPDWLGTITQVKAWFKPANASRSGNAPQNQPKLQLYRLLNGDISANAVQVGTVQLAAVGETAYELTQVLTLTLGGGGHDILSDYAYWVVFEGESGTDSATGLQLSRVQLQLIPQ